MSDTKVGQLIDETALRDAIHMAIAPVISGGNYRPGEHVGFMPDGRIGIRAEKKIGIIDPFLENGVSAGERCYIFLYPQTVTGMRHHWAHPAFGEVKVESSDPKEVSKRWLSDLASKCGVSYEKMMDAVEADNYIHMGENESYKTHLDGVIDEFHKHIETVTGKVYQGYPFSCSC